MEYSISEVAEKMNLTIPTLRYYDNIGLLQKLKKDKRIYELVSAERFYNRKKAKFI